MSPLSLIRFRSLVPADVPFVATSWLRSYGDHGRAVRGVHAGRDMEDYAPVIDKLLRRCTTVIAHNADSPQHIIGWACIEATGNSGVVHYVYVKRPYRRNGFAGAMLEGFGGFKRVLHSHETDSKDSFEAVKRLSERLRSEYSPGRAWI